MGTSYTLYKNKKFEFSINEMSNELSLFVNNLSETSLKTPKMAPEELLKIFMEGIKVISYWMPEEQFNKIFSGLRVYPY